MSTAKDLGTRHVCWKCEAKFYDLNRPSPACPKCGADPRERPALKAVTKPAKAAAPAVAPKPAEEQAEDDDELGDDSFDDLDEDAEEDDEEDNLY